MINKMHLKNWNVKKKESIFKLFRNLKNYIVLRKNLGKNKKYSIRFPFIYVYYFAAITKSIKQSNHENKYKRQTMKNRISTFSIPKMLLVQQNYSKSKYFRKIWQLFWYQMGIKSSYLYTWHKQREIWRNNRIQAKWIKNKESRKLKWIQAFYRNFGFYINKKKRVQPFLRTKRYKKYHCYNEVIELAANKKKIKKNTYFPIQSIRLNGPSYFKIKWQFASFYIKNYFPNNLKRKKISQIAKKISTKKKEKLIHFWTKIEFNLCSLLLRMRLLRTVEIAKQFIKHGAVFINYRKILSPSYIVKPGDSICIHVPFKKKKCHRLYDPLYVRRSLHGLYRQNTGRQSLTAIEKHQTFLKASSNLNIVSKWKDTDGFSNQTIIPDIHTIVSKDRNVLNNYLPNSSSTQSTGWKFNFFLNQKSGINIQRNKYVDYIKNNIA